METIKTQELEKTAHMYKLFCFIYAKIPAGRAKEIENIKVIRITDVIPEVKLLSIRTKDHHFFIQDETHRNTLTITDSNTLLLRTTYVGSLFDDTEDFYSEKNSDSIDTLYKVIQLLKNSFGSK